MPKTTSKTAYTDYSAAQKQAKENEKAYGKKTIRKHLGNFAVKIMSSRAVIKSSLINNGSGFGGFKKETV